jgi:CRISPR-associated protein Cmr4
MEIRPFLLQALSPLHAGTGQSAGVIDLPIARMRATGIPFVPGSSIKGVLRDARKPAESAPSERHAAVFGPERRDKSPGGDDASLDHAGALIVADARLVALPVRSFVGTFALVSSPLLLHLAHRDLVEAGVRILGSVSPEPIKLAPDHGAVPGKGCINVPSRGNHLYLEELDLPIAGDPKLVEKVTAWARVLAAALPEVDRELLTKRFVVVDDETMTFLWESATQVDTRVRIGDKGVVETGALWTEESLPAESLLLGLLSARASLRTSCKLDATSILDEALPASEILQFGGKATTGKGRCRINTWKQEGK